MAYIKKKEASKQEIAYKRIKLAIINNEFEEDSIIIEDKLCEMLGFSKTPIREALRRLTSEGFLESIPEKGTFVKRISIDEAIQLYDVREVLEGLAARLCALKRKKETLDMLGEILHDLEIGLNEKKNEESIQLDLKFHQVVINGSGNDRLINFTRTMIEQIHRFASGTIFERSLASFEEHQKVYEAIRNGEEDNAEKYLKEHIRSVKEYQINKHLNIKR